MMKNEKGFLGPIGDDLPSLIPLILSLVIFFSAFTYAFNVFNYKSEAFRYDLDTMNIVRVMRASGYITGPENFQQLCNSVTVTDLRYVVGITDQVTNGYFEDPENETTGINLFEIEDKPFFTLGSEDEYFEYVCPNEDARKSLTDEVILNSQILVKIMPIVVEHNRTAKPMHLVVVTWV